MGSNCLVSTSIGCLFCWQGCNAEKLRNGFLFVPPVPSYRVEDQPSASSGASAEASPSGLGKLVYEMDGLSKYAFYKQAAENADVRFLRTAQGERIPVVWLRRSGAASNSRSPPLEQRTLVLLHCHGNATDIGMMMGPYLEMSNQLGVEVVGVEYSGYGMSSGTPSTRKLHGDIEAAYNHVIASGVPPEHIVAYGQSVGSGPVLSLAAKRKLGGIVLHSPMLSGIKVIDPDPDKCCCRPSCCYRCFDFFPNDERIRSISCPAFVIHGQQDDIIPFYHGQRLAEATPMRQRWPGYFPARAGHNDVVEMDPRSYFGEVGAFLRSIAEGDSGNALPLGGLGAIGSDAGGVARKPQQVEMVVEPSVCGARTTAEDCPNGAAGGTLLAFSEPAAGPEDGRYAQWRRGQGKALGTEA
jgi:hypothetical protein